MKNLFATFVFLFLLSFLCKIYAVEQTFDTVSSSAVAHYLSWVPGKPCPDNLCGGYYKEPHIVLDYPIPPPAKSTKLHITADKQVYYAKTGDSVFTGNVIITQPGRLVTADKMVAHREPKTGRIISADLTGHVNMRENGKLIVGNHGFMDFAKNVLTIDHSIYRLSAFSPTGYVNVWGRAVKSIRDDKNKTLLAENVTYSTCQPNSKTWHFRSKKLNLNQQTGYGIAYNSTLYFYNTPIFWLPYLEFSIDARRKTGFLYPTYAYNNDSGSQITIPFYWNIAPNYDAMITPEFITKRGLLMDGQFRYLTDKSKGEIHGGFIFDDKAFKKFQSDDLAPYDINYSNNRGYIAFSNSSKYDAHWSAKEDINYVTDDYFMRDFYTAPTEINTDQLLNQARINFQSERWDFVGLLQAFQTLHMPDDSSNPQDQY